MEAAPATARDGTASPGHGEQGCGTGPCGSRRSEAMPEAPVLPCPARLCTEQQLDPYVPPKKRKPLPPPALPARKLLGPFQRPGAAGMEPGAWVSPVPVREDLPGTGGIYPVCGDLPRVPGWLLGPRAWDLQHLGSKWKWGQAARAPPGLRDKSPSPAAGEAGPCPTASLPVQEVLRFVLCLC